MNMQFHHQQFNYEQFHILKHITKTRARILTNKLTIITIQSKHLCKELEKRLQLRDYD